MEFVNRLIANTLTLFHGLSAQRKVICVNRGHKCAEHHDNNPFNTNENSINRHSHKILLSILIGLRVPGKSPPILSGGYSWIDNMTSRQIIYEIVAVEWEF